MSVNTSAKKFNWSILHTIVVILFMFGFRFLPPIGSVTAIGMGILGVFIGLLYGWSTCGMFWPSLLGIFALGLTGAGNVKSMVLAAFSNEIVVFLLFILILAQMLEENGAINCIVAFIISRKSLQNKPWLFSFAFLVAAGILGTFGQAFAAIFLCWGILENLFRKVGYKPYERYPTMMIIGVVVSIAAINAMVPFKNTPLLLLGTYTSLTGVQVNYFQYMLVMIPTGLAMLLGYLLVCRLFLRPDVSRLSDMNIDELIKPEDKIISKRQKASLLAFGFLLLTLLIPGSLPSNWSFVIWLNSIGVAGSMIFCTILFSLIKVEGKPLFDFTRCAKSGMNWSILFMVAVLMLISSQLMSDSAGVKTFIVELLSPIFANTSGMVLLISLFIIGAILTNFMNNMVVGFMLIPVLVALSDTVPVNILVGVLLILISTNAAYMTPAASPAAALLFAKTDWLRGKDVVIVGALTIFTFIATGLIVTLGLGNIVF